MIRIAILAGTLVLGIGPAAGQPVGGAPTGSAPADALATGTISSAAPTLKREVTVTSDIVRIGDLVDHAGAAASIPIFRAPDPGETGTVAAYRVADAVRPYGISLDTRDNTEVTVAQAGHAILPKDIQAVLARALAARLGLGEAKDLSITFDAPLRPIHLRPSLSTELEPRDLTYDRRRGRFDITLAVAGTAASGTTFRYTGTVVEMSDVAGVAGAVARGAVLKQSDVVIERRPKAASADGAFRTATGAVGLAARHALSAGQVLRSIDLMKPEIVHQNEPVMLVYETPGITLTVRGKAVNSGAEGDIVGVINLQSNRTVQGKVVAPGRVRIAASEPPASDAADASGRVDTGEATASHQ